MRSLRSDPSTLGLLLLAGALSGCATAPDRGLAEAERIWRCSSAHPLPRGQIQAWVTLTRAGTPREAIRFRWRRDLAPHGSIEIDWHETEGVAPPGGARAWLSFPLGARANGHRRLELRRGRPDGSPGETVFASAFEPRPWRATARWGHVLEAARDGPFFGVAADRHGRIHARTRIERDIIAEPAPAAAAALAEMRAMIADHERRCQQDWSGEGRIVVT